MKLVIYKGWNSYMVTPEDNYNARIQDARKIHRMDDFESPQEVIDYFVQYFGSKPEDFTVID